MAPKKGSLGFGIPWAFPSTEIRFPVVAHDMLQRSRRCLASSRIGSEKDRLCFVQQAFCPETLSMSKCEPDIKFLEQFMRKAIILNSKFP